MHGEVVVGIRDPRDTTATLAYAFEEAALRSASLVAVHSWNWSRAASGGADDASIAAEAELNLIPRPKARGLLVPHFSSLAAAMDAVAACLEHKPSAVELMDQQLL